MPLFVWAKEPRAQAYWRKVGQAVRNEDGSITFFLFSLKLLAFRISETKPQ